MVEECVTDGAGAEVVVGVVDALLGAGVLGVVDGALVGSVSDMSLLPVHATKISVAADAIEARNDRFMSAASSRGPN